MSLDSISRHKRARYYLPGLLLFVILIQFFSLVRNYPAEPACGRVVSINQNLNVLVNCDSAVFMKDADNPSRLWNGESDYVDRPLFAITINKMYGILKSIGIPDTRREIKGISGDSYSYSYLIYGLFILLNLIILVSAIIVFFKVMLENFGSDNHSFVARMLLIFNALFFLGANELSKTFFWTPHSQIFNILIPVIALWVIHSPRVLQKPIYFYLFSSWMGILMFAYPAFGLVLILLCFTGFLSWRSRMIAVVLSAIPYLMYPYILRFLGYQYENKAIEKFREFIWVIDGMTGKSSWTIYFEKFWSFLGSLPLFPSTLIIISFIFILRGNPYFFKSRKNQLFIGFFAFYICYVLGIGLGERRISLALILFSGLYVYLYFAELNKGSQPKYFNFVLSLLTLVQIGCWVFTTGPLV